MQITLTLNDERIDFEADAEESLLDVLRERRLFKVKCGCREGHCGSCMVLLDNKPVPSCIIPIGILRNASVETLEHFTSNPIYLDIMAGFKEAGVTLCGYCDAGKILTAYDLLHSYPRASIEQIKEAIKRLDSCCTDSETLINGILYSIAAKHRREASYGRK